LVGVAGQRPEDDPFEACGDAGPQGAWFGGLAGQPHHRGGQVGGRLERRAAGQHLEQDDADRVQVGAPIDLAALHLLGGEVSGRTDQGAGRGQLPGVERGLGDAEVCDLDHPVPDEDVRRLHVPVDQAGRMGGRQGGQDRLHQVHHPVRPQGGLTAKEGTQALALEVLHHDVPDVVLLAGVEHAYDVGVGEASGGHGFPLEPLGETRIRRQILTEDLDRDLPGQDLVAGPPDGGHAAGGGQFFEDVAPPQAPPGRDRLHGQASLPAVRCSASG
jgi:hypothetical protein